MQESGLSFFFSFSSFWERGGMWAGSFSLFKLIGTDTVNSIPSAILIHYSSVFSTLFLSLFSWLKLLHSVLLSSALSLVHLNVLKCFFPLLPSFLFIKLNAPY